MTTATATLTFDSTSDANWRAWGSGVSALFSAGGLVQTADTGQINWSTVGRTTVTTTGGEYILGYEIWRFNDALQATCPIYLKVEYGQFTMVNNLGSMEYSGFGPVIYVTLGTATNGAGTLTGTLVGTRTRLAGASAANTGINTHVTTYNATWTPVSGSSPCYASGGDSYFNLALGVTPSGQANYLALSGGNIYAPFPAILSIERTRTNVGAATGDGFYWFTVNWPINGGTTVTTPTAAFQVHCFNAGTNTVSPLTNYVPFAVPGPLFGSANFSGNTYFNPLPIMAPGPMGQALGSLATWKGDVPLASQQVVAVSGSSRTYLSLAGISGPVAADNARSVYWSTIPNGAMLLRYE